MSDTTADIVKLIAPQLKTFIDAEVATVNLILSDVAGEVTQTQYGGKEEKAQRYLAAHALTLIEAGSSGGSSSTSGPLKRVKVGQEEREYSDGSDFLGKNRLDETVYGREFNRIRSGCILGFQSFRP